MALNTDILVRIAATATKALDFSSPSDALVKEVKKTLTSGTGANQSDQSWHDQRTTDDTGEELNLAALAAPLGGTLTMTKVKAMLIVAATGNTVDVAVGGAAATQFSAWIGGVTEKAIIKPGGTLLIMAPDANGFDASTGTKLKVAAAVAGTITYDIVLIGVGTVV